MRVGTSLLLMCLCCCCGLAFASRAFAVPVGVETVIVTDDPDDLAATCDDEFGLQVCNVYVEFDFSCVTEADCGTCATNSHCGQNEVCNARNRLSGSSLRTSIRRLHEAIEAGEGSAIQTQWVETQGMIDRTARLGIIHRNAAARTKSRLARRVQLASAS